MGFYSGWITLWERRSYLLVAIQAVSVHVLFIERSIAQTDHRQQQSNVYFISLEGLSNKNTIFPSLSNLLVSDSNS